MSSAGLTTGLNPAQVEAVTHHGGPLLVVAGAGSGKTRVLTHRIAHLIDERDVSPFAILAITFTNKAAQEMKNRVGSLIGPVANKMWVSTFHSACARILRYEAEAIDFPSSFTIYDQADSVRLTNTILRSLNYDTKKMPPRSIHAAISAAKNEMLSVSQFKDRASNVFERRVGEIYEEYQRRLHQAGAMDFDDLLGNTVELFRRAPEVLTRYRQRFQHILVDEFQDTNQVQNNLVIALGQDHRNVFAVGDADQSVYRFRGADVRNILEFERAFNDAKVVLLEQNYRSTQHILDAANAVIENNLGRKPKKLWTDTDSGAPIVRYCASDEYAEARWVVREVSRLHEAEHVRWDEIAVFYRTNAQSRVIEEVLLEAGLPYQLIGGTRFYDRKEVKDALAYLRVVVNPADAVSLRRAIAAPKRGVGDTSIAKLQSWADAHGLSLMDAFTNAADAGVKGRALSGIQVFLKVIGDARELLNGGPVMVLEHLLDTSGYRAQQVAEACYESGGPTETSVQAQGRLENLDELVSVASEFDNMGDFLEQISLVSDTDDMTDDSGLTLMTLHSAKGLEYPVVFLVGMEESVFPHARSLTEPDELEEERRLAYVGITRAQQRLYLTHAWARNVHGTTMYNRVSRFLEEIPAELVENRGGSRSHSSGFSYKRSADSPVNRSYGKATANDVGATPIAADPDPVRVAVGDDVNHAKFGLGVVTDIKDADKDAEITVNFVSAGNKVLLASYARLEKV
ncbi:MAG: DNA helicase PcrA [Acidimicrobiia bacterium]|nr:DNA helicase PcrA [Acidimicrobiia bacterium]MYC58003.1 DNA helicase PcrA [Acidimicrobiia bacterium]MYI31048.1 DNA helicase PcrA [Acidimicrobiia bacterium]